MIVGISGLAGSGKDACADILVREHGWVKVALADPIKRAVADIYGFSRDQLWGPSASRNAPDERYPRRHGPFTKAASPLCACCGASSMEAMGRKDLEQFGIQSKPGCFLTPRFALQQLGTEYGRHCYQNTWVDYALRIAERLSKKGYYTYTPERGLVGGPPTAAMRVMSDLEQPPRSVVIPDVRFKNEIDGLRAHGAKLIRIVRPNAGLGGSAGQHVSETEQASIPDEAFDVVIQNDGTLGELGEKVKGWLK